jgi:hypothetical protein
MYREHHNLPNEAMPTRIQPNKKKTLLVNEIASHLLEVKRMIINKKKATTLDNLMRILSTNEYGYILIPHCFDD